MRSVLIATCSGTQLFQPFLAPQAQVTQQSVGPMDMYQPVYADQYVYAEPPQPQASAQGSSFAVGVCALLGGMAVGRVATLKISGKDSMSDVFKAMLAAALTFGSVNAASAGPFTRSEIASLTYDQIKGTGLANTCPQTELGAEGTSKISLKGGSNYRIDDFCLEPTSFQVLEDRMTKNGLVTEPVNTKVTTRQTYVLTGIEGELKQDGGKLTFVEQDGIDYAATTVQLPGGERVPFLFTVKNLVAKSDQATSSIEPGLKMSGGFRVPSYRTGLFLDPKGRGTTTGYDQAVALPAMQAGGDEQMFKENNKTFDVLDGNLELKITAVNNDLGEIGGVFVSQQPSDTDLGSKAPKQVLLKGNWFATVNEQ
jgi:photosystem II oxygen-evolving enhancer protein 1